MQTPTIAPVTFPHTFKADNLYRWGLAAMSFFGIAGAIYAVSHPSPSIRFIGLALPVIVLWIVILSLRIRVDETGFTQSWILGTRSLAWGDVARLDKTARTISVVDQSGKETISLSMLPHSAQIAIAEETIARAGLQKSSEKRSSHGCERWVPKT